MAKNEQKQKQIERDEWMEASRGDWQQVSGALWSDRSIHLAGRPSAAIGRDAAVTTAALYRAADDLDACQ